MSGGGRAAYLVVPVKRSVGSKQRLVGQLPDGVRQLVSRALAARMVRCAAEGWPAQQVVVVTDEPEVSALCQRLGIATLADGGGGHSQAVRLGQALCLSRGATALATLAADLPRAEPADLRQLFELCSELEDNSLRLITDRAGTGTNGLLLRPADLDCFLFGPDSLRRHRDLAQRQGLQFEVLALDRLTWDIDRLEDLVEPQGAGLAHPVVAWAREVAERVGGPPHLGEAPLRG